MRKSELKAILRPLIKQCIRECILEEGVLSSIIMEVTKGLGAEPIVEQKARVKPEQASVSLDTNNTAATPRTVNQRLTEHKKKLMEAIGSAYGGVDLFEGTTPAPGQGTPTLESNPLYGVGSGDAGIDISGIMAVGGKKWKSLI